MIARLLGNLGSRSEVEQYLKHYGQGDARKWAVIQVSGEALEEALDDVASALAFLAEVGLQPIVVHGARPQIKSALAGRGLALDASRDGRPEVLDVVRRVSHRANNQLLEALENLGVRARSITAGVFRAEPGAQGRFGLSSRAVSVDLESVRWALTAGAVPVISALGETGEGQILSLDPAAAARSLAGNLRPHKLVFLDERGGLPGPTGRRMSAVNLAEDYETLVADPAVETSVKETLSALYELLLELPSESSVSFTAPHQLAKELFTHTGAGTLVRLGVRVNAFERFDALDTRRLRALLEECFQKPLDPHYFRHREAHRVYLSADYRATAVVVDLGAGVPYLDKFAVTAAAQGEGLGASVWRRLTRDEPKLFWRARPDNPINPWYFRHSQGSFHADGWVVFWYGLSDFQAAKALVDRASALPPTFIESSPRSE